MQIEIKTLLTWGAGKRVQSARGERIVSTASPTEAFWGLYRANKIALNEAGVSVTKNKKSGEWEVCWWQQITKEELEQRAAVAQLSRKATTDFNPPCNDGLSYLPFQRAGIQFAINAMLPERGCLIGDEMGLGKTIQAIGFVNSKPEINRVLIICPNTLKINWRNELNKWLVRPLKVGIQYAGQPYVGDLVDVLLINYDIVSKFPELKKSRWDLRVMDECHFVKNAKAQRTKATLAIKSTYKLALSGTPMLNRPVELFTILNDLDKDSWPSAFSYAKRYCDAKHNGFGWDFSGASNLEELQDRLRGTIMVRRLKADVLTELPPKRRQLIQFEVNGAAELVREEKEQYEQRAERISELSQRVEIAKAGEDRAAYESAVMALREGQGALFAEMAKIRHEVALKKLPKCIEFVREALESSKVIVFAHHLDIVAQLESEFPQAAIVTGETKAELRQGEVEKFQNQSDCNIFIGNLAAAEGLTLTAATHVIFVEGQWVPGKLAQMEDRAHRIGQHDSVLCSYLVLEGSLDAVMAKSCVEKMDVCDRTLDREHAAMELQVPIVTLELVEAAPEPIVSERKAAAQAPATFDGLAKEGVSISQEKASRALQGMKMLAGMDEDHAAEVNGMGFSKFDGLIGHSLANCSKLTPKQAALACRLCIKYRKQLGEDFLNI